MSPYFKTVAGFVTR